MKKRTTRRKVLQKGAGFATRGEGGERETRRIWWSAITSKRVTLMYGRKDKEVREKIEQERISKRDGDILCA